jgi:hypothetical protein
MGILSFWKKKTPDVPRIDSPGKVSSDLADVNMLPDLPSIDGNDMSQPPVLFELPKTGDQNTLSTNNPVSNFSMPMSDDESLPSSSNPSGSPNPPSLPFLSEDVNPTFDVDKATQNSGNIELPAFPNAQQNSKVDSNTGTRLDPKDVSNLFINDTEWKEPNLANYDPYSEETIEEPHPDDFGSQGLPQFDTVEPATDSAVSPLVADVLIAEPNEPFSERQRAVQSPVELFIRGKAYSRVFVELEQMNKTLSKINSQAGTYEELLKKEEPLTQAVKEQAEYLYRKLNNIDKKLFVQ